MYFAIIRHFQNQNTDIQPYRVMTSSDDKVTVKSSGILPSLRTTALPASVSFGYLESAKPHERFFKTK